MQPDYSKEDRQYVKWGVPPPSRTGHGTVEEVRANLKPARISRWYLEGNKLVAETDLGPVVNYLPTNYIMRGVDAKGLPILEEINV